MRRKRLLVFICCFFLFQCFTGCSSFDDRPSEAIMPYSSEEYESEPWTVESLEEHFKSLGFYDIKTKINKTLHKEDVGIETVEIEIYPSDSWFTEYRRIAKGDTYETHREIRIEATTYVSTIDISNNSEFAELVKANEDTAYDLFEQFLSENEGEFIEFDATVVRCGPPTPSSKGIYIWFAVEQGNVILYKNGVKASDLGLETGVHSCGQGAKVHIVGIIKDNDVEIKLMTITEPKEIVSETETITENQTTQTEQPTTPSESNKQTYRLNRNTKKFHYSYCQHAKRIKPGNREEYFGERSKLIKKGYSPCDSCNP